MSAAARPRLLPIALIGLAAAGVVWLAQGGPPAAPDPAATGIPPYALPLDAGVPVDKEIAFYRGRVAKAPDAFLEQNMLAAAYLRKARETGDPAWQALAARAAQASLAAMPTMNPEAELVGAHLAIAGHRFPAARRVVEQVRKKHPAAAVAGLLATIDLAQGRTADALRGLERVVVASPTTAAYGQLGLARAARGDDRGAEAAFREAIRREQAGDRLASADARAWLARLALRRGRLAEAVAFATEASRIWPRHPVALAVLADAAARGGDLLAAAEGWKRVEDLRADPAATLARARVARARGNAAEAAAAWTELERRLDQEAARGVRDHQRDLARLLLDRGAPGDAQEAERLLEAERHNREDAETLDLHVGALLAIGRVDGARAAIEALKATGALEAPYLYREAAVLKAEGKAAEARAVMAEADALDPTFRQDPAFRDLVE